MPMVPLPIDTEAERIAISQKFLDKTKHDLGDENIQTIVKEGATDEVILESAKKMKADIVVIGTHSRKWLEKIIMGSVAEKVLESTTLPLYIIPTKKEAE